MNPDNPEFILVFLLVFFVLAGGFSFLLNGLLLKFSNTLGMRNSHEIIRWSSSSKPSLGGITFFIIFLLSVVCYFIIFPNSTGSMDKSLFGLLFATGIAFLMGLSDDAYNTRPLFKLFSQIFCGIILILTGTYISLFSSELLNYIITIFWVVGIMNSINMLDNMDGIVAIVSMFITSTAILIIILQHNFNEIHLFLLSGVLAALIGFTFYNWHPSKIFMGDTGSQFLGVFLAAMGIIYFWNNKEFGSETEVTSKQVIIAVLAFIIPIIDTTTVTINRILRGHSPFIGGKDHTTHHLSYLGLSDKQVALVFGILSMLSFFLIFIAAKFINSWSFYHFLAFTAYALILFIILFCSTHTQKAKAKYYAQLTGNHPKKDQ